VVPAEYVRQWLGSRVEIDLRPGGSANLGWPEEGYANGWARSSGSTRRTSSRSAGAREANVPFDPAGANTLVEFTLAADGDGTRLRLAESGFTEEAHRKDPSSRPILSSTSLLLDRCATRRLHIDTDRATVRLHVMGLCQPLVSTYTPHVRGTGWQWRRPDRSPRRDLQS